MPDPSHVWNLHHSSWQRQIFNPLIEARDRTASSWMLVRFMSAEPWRELQLSIILKVRRTVKWNTTCLSWIHCNDDHLCQNPLRTVEIGVTPWQVQSQFEYQRKLYPNPCYLFIFFVFFAISWAASAAYGGSQARGRIGAVAAGRWQSHSNTGSEPCLQPTPHSKFSTFKPPHSWNQEKNKFY